MMPMISPARIDNRSNVVMSGRKRYQVTNKQKIRIQTSMIFNAHSFLTISFGTSSSFIKDTTARYDLPMNSPNRKKVM